jgi:hypothetical protein
MNGYPTIDERTFPRSRVTSGRGAHGELGRSPGRVLELRAGDGRVRAETARARELRPVARAARAHVARGAADAGRGRRLHRRRERAGKSRGRIGEVDVEVGAVERVAIVGARYIFTQAGLQNNRAQTPKSQKRNMG